MSNLTIEVLKEMTQELKKFKRMPIIHYSEFALAIYKGELIDAVLEEALPDFNKDCHKGYLVPVKYKKEIESSSGSKIKSM